MSTQRERDQQYSVQDRKLLADFGDAVGCFIRDTGHVMWCEECRRAEMPGRIRCCRCGGPVIQARSSKRKQAAQEAA